MKYFTRLETFWNQDSFQVIKRQLLTCDDVVTNVKYNIFCFALGLSCIYLSYYRKLCYLLSPEILDHISVYCYSHISHIYIVVWWYVPCSHNKLMYAYNLKTKIQFLGMKFKLGRHFNPFLLLIDVKLWIS